MRYLRALRRGEHALGLHGVEREGLLADDMPAGFTGFDGERRVRVGRRGDGDRFDVVERECVVQRRTRTGYFESIGPALRAGRVASDQRADGEARISQRGDVHPAAESGTDDDRAGH